jgi:hypothetical protein
LTTKIDDGDEELAEPVEGDAAQGSLHFQAWRWYQGELHISACLMHKSSSLTSTLTRWFYATRSINSLDIILKFQPNCSFRCHGTR